MNHLALKTTVSLAAMFVLLIMALAAQEATISKLTASLAIIVGAITTNNLSTQKKFKQ